MLGTIALEMHCRPTFHKAILGIVKITKVTHSIITEIFSEGMVVNWGGGEALSTCMCGDVLSSHVRGVETHCSGGADSGARSGLYQGPCVTISFPVY